ncbi:23S ribosomal RNA methyltransferase Erm [Paenibacillus sp. FSL W8-0194]|uniref:23S ribosomal RNA methyltransferase Erm n=1 Tax=Paenibacillus sp. FSL W8-0194 TaxID=2921711 RepID=UPI0030D84495
MISKNDKSRTNICSWETPNFSGQHLLHHKKTIQDIVDAANVGKQDTVLDLGAGKGALTAMLNQKAGRVLAVEIDRRFVEILKRKNLPYPNTKVIHEDILNMRLPKEPFTVVSNIPYSITTPILKKLLSKPSSGFQRGVIVMEKGAAKRFTAKTAKDPYIVAWKMWFDIRYVKDIPRQSFAPPPKVDSALVAISRKAKPIVPMKDYPIFWGMAEHMLKNPGLSVDLALRGLFTAPQIKHVKRSLGARGDLPVASLSEHQWGIVFDSMVRHVPKFRWPKAKKEKFGCF